MSDLPICLRPGLGFWRDKYRLLGAFGDKYQGRYPIPFDSMIASRDAVAALPGGEQGERRAEAYFERTFVYSEEFMAGLRRHGMLAVGIDVPAQLQRMLGAGTAGRG